MNTMQLRIFVSVAASRNMTRTAQEMHMTQPAVSQSIAKLEQEVDAMLFIRKKRELELTQKGLLFYQRAQNILRELDMALAECQTPDTPLYGTLSLQICSASALMPGMLNGFRTLYPNIRYSITQNADDLADYDFRIAYAQGDAMPMNAVPLFEEEVLLAVPKHHHLAGRNSIHLIEARDEDFLLLQKWMALGRQGVALCRQAGFEPKVVFQCDNPTTLREMVTLANGVTFVPHISWHTAISSELRLLHITSPICRRWLGLYSSPGKRHTPVTKAFSQYAINYFDEFKRACLQGE